MTKPALLWRIALHLIGNCTACLYVSPAVFGLVDTDLYVPQEKIYNKHGEVTLQHDGRDSTGKHWIKCFSVSYPHSSKNPPYYTNISNRKYDLALSNAPLKKLSSACIQNLN